MGIKELNKLMEESGSVAVRVSDGDVDVSVKAGEEVDVSIASDLPVTDPENPEGDIEVDSGVQDPLEDDATELNDGLGESLKCSKCGAPCTGGDGESPICPTCGGSLVPIQEADDSTEDELGKEDSGYTPDSDSVDDSTEDDDLEKQTVVIQGPADVVIGGDASVSVSGEQVDEVDDEDKPIVDDEEDDDNLNAALEDDTLK